MSILYTNPYLYLTVPLFPPGESTIPPYVPSPIAPILTSTPGGTVTPTATPITVQNIALFSGIAPVTPITLSIPVEQQEITPGMKVKLAELSKLARPIPAPNAFPEASKWSNELQNYARWSTESINVWEDQSQSIPRAFVGGFAKFAVGTNVLLGAAAVTGRAIIENPVEAGRQLASITAPAIISIPSEMYGQFAEPIREKGIVRGMAENIGGFVGMVALGKATDIGVSRIRSNVIPLVEARFPIETGFLKGTASRIRTEIPNIESTFGLSSSSSKHYSMELNAIRTEFSKIYSPVSQKISPILTGGRATFGEMKDIYAMSSRQTTEFFTPQILSEMKDIYSTSVRQTASFFKTEIPKAYVPVSSTLRSSSDYIRSQIVTGREIGQNIFGISPGISKPLLSISRARERPRTNIVYDVLSSGVIEQKIRPGIFDFIQNIYKEPLKRTTTKLYSTELPEYAIPKKIREQFELVKMTMQPEGRIRGHEYKIGMVWKSREPTIKSTLTPKSLFQETLEGGRTTRLKSSYTGRKQVQVIPERPSEFLRANVEYELIKTGKRPEYGIGVLEIPRKLAPGSVSKSLSLTHMTLEGVGLKIQREREKEWEEDIY